MSDFYGSRYWSDDELDELKGRREVKYITAEVFSSALLGWSWRCASPHPSPEVLIGQSMLESREAAERARDEHNVKYHNICPACGKSLTN
jgi:hypothetical protein